MTSEEIMERVLAAEPDLSLYGFRDDFAGGPYSNRERKFPAEKFRQDRDQMLSPHAIEQFDCACEWLNRQPRTKRTNRRPGTSYSLKHVAEKEVEVGYLPNGIFIAAALACGFKIRRQEDGPNAWINISTDKRRYVNQSRRSTGF